MSDLVWEEPPGYRAPSHVYQEFADQLRSHPKRWARLPMYNDRKQNAGDSAGVKQGRYKAFRPAGAFEATFRQGVTYVRYVGENQS